MGEPRLRLLLLPWRFIFLILSFVVFFALSPLTRTLVLYSNPGCCLFLISVPNSLHDVVLQVRDITTDPEWKKAYQYEIPVLAKLRPDGTEEILLRLSPRLGVELIQKKLASALNQ